MHCQRAIPRQSVAGAIKSDSSPRKVTAKATLASQTLPTNTVSVDDLHTLDKSLFVAPAGINNFKDYTEWLISEGADPETPKPRHTVKRPTDHVSRPVNGFISMRSSVGRRFKIHGIVVGSSEAGHQSETSKWIAFIWRQILSEDQRGDWNRLSLVVKKQHIEEHPDYKYSPDRSRVKVPRNHQPLSPKAKTSRKARKAKKNVRRRRSPSPYTDSEYEPSPSPDVKLEDLIAPSPPRSDLNSEFEVEEMTSCRSFSSGASRAANSPSPGEMFSSPVKEEPIEDLASPHFSSSDESEPTFVQTYTSLSRSERAVRKLTGLNTTSKGLMSVHPSVSPLSSDCESPSSIAVHIDNSGRIIAYPDELGYPFPSSPLSAAFPYDFASLELRRSPSPFCLDDNDATNVAAMAQLNLGIDSIIESSGATSAFQMPTAFAPRDENIHADESQYIDYHPHEIDDTTPTLGSFSVKKDVAYDAFLTPTQGSFKSTSANWDTTWDESGWSDSSVFDYSAWGDASDTSK